MRCEPACTYVSDVDELALLCTGLSVISERVRCGRSRCSTTGIEAGSTWGSTSAEASSSTVPSAEAATATEASTAAITPAEAAATKSTTAATETATHADSTTGIAVFTDLEVSALPVEVVELLNGSARVISGLEYDNSGSFGTSIGSHVDIGSDNGSITGCRGVES